TAFNAEKKGVESGKGALNCQISSLLFELLSKNGVESHYIKRLNDIDMLCKKVSIIPIEVVVRNIATGSLTKR
ncbi:phosphoribosylaminoimidazolesuccinocarboxamide synthase, partial [Helicobacter cinaedi]